MSNEQPPPPESHQNQQRPLSKKISKSSFIPSSMTPIFNEESQDVDKTKDQQKDQQRLSKEKSRKIKEGGDSVHAVDTRAAGILKQGSLFGGPLMPLTNADIFETMEREMKQIMDLFAKERKSRKKEMAKLQA